MAHLLVVDDDPLLRESLELELLDAGYLVTTASDGIQALEIATGQAFDLVLSDIRMPGMLGLEMLGRLKALQPAIKTIVMTAYASPETPIEALRLRVDDYLLKPFDGEALLASLQKALPRQAEDESGPDARCDRLLESVSWLLDHSEQQRKVADRALVMARALGFSPERSRVLYLAALLSGGPDRLLTTVPWLKPLWQIARRSRENWDGSGPMGLRGEEIPLESRLLAAALARPVEHLDPNLVGDIRSDQAALGADNLLRLAGKHVEQGHLEQALALYQRAAVVSPGAAEIEIALCRGRAQIHQIRGDTELAQRELLIGLDIATAHHLELEEARLALSAAELGPFDGSDLALSRASAEFEMWEMASHAARASSLLTPEKEDAPPSEPQRVALEVELLGGLRVRAGGELLDDETWVSRKDRSLFAYLASRAGQVVHEDKLVELLWSQGGAKARHSLHNSLSKIRGVLKARLGDAAKGVITKKRDGYLFAAAPLSWVDAVEFSSNLEKGRALAEADRWSEALPLLQRADALYGGELVAGTYESWLDRPRQRLAAELTECRKLLALHFTRAGKLEIARQLWERVLEHDSCDETAYGELMRCLGDLGRPAEAIRVYHRCVAAMRDELDLAPPVEVSRQYLELVAKPDGA